MPLIAIQSMHGGNDFPLHIALLQELENRRLLEKYTFAIDPLVDPIYCLYLRSKFPGICLTTELYGSRALMQLMSRTLGRGYSYLTRFGKFDAVCEAPGGRLTRSVGNLFHAYPRVRKRAILFHSIEQSCMDNGLAKSLVKECDLVISRTRRSAKFASKIGAARVIASSDIVFSQNENITKQIKPGIAVALQYLKYANKNERDELGEKFNARMKDFILGIVSAFENVDMTALPHAIWRDFDIEPPFNAHVSIFDKNDFYLPFKENRDLIISQRLHPTIVALLAGNRKILQFQVELGTSKIEDIFSDIGLHSLRVYPQEKISGFSIGEILTLCSDIPDAEAEAAIVKAKSLVNVGMDAFQEWLESL